MTIPLAPPPLQVPPEFILDKNKQGFFTALVNTIYQMWTALYGIRTTATVKTTNATNTGILRIKVATNKTLMVVAHIVARRTGGSAGSNGDSAWYTLSGAYKNISGTLTAIGTPDLIGGEDQGGWNVGFTTSGEEIVVLVTGAANNNITWEGTFSTYTVGA